MNSALITQLDNFMASRIDDEFVVVSLRSGKFLHFNSATESFVDFFREPRGVHDFVKSHAVPPEEVETLEAFTAFLIEEQILAPVDGKVAFGDLPTNPRDYSRPKLVRVGEKNLSECEFSYP